MSHSEGSGFAARMAEVDKSLGKGVNRWNRHIEWGIAIVGGERGVVAAGIGTNPGAAGVAYGVCADAYAATKVERC